MQVTLMKGKIHRAHVTEADLHYEGSISIDRNLIEAAGFLINERVDIYNIDTGARFSTYVIEAPAGSGTIGLNGAAARLAMAGDKVIIVAYASFDADEARKFHPRVVLVDDKNRYIAKAAAAPAKALADA
ncbi:aspartate 1-decarboxylase [Bradyrhizobium sp. Arg62]|uniref:aspartate 1-decarboxylase n=1 Tax=Bradyrhizobium brasilense TaxID=1419277 RepID=UPI001E3C648E|nr:aspartate 1-decarboxylase [Bradyrhizobium brasilense]MCC8950129.1 aspartate 1-decarboxylase [Bradyrhizobium brasilense]